RPTADVVRTRQADLYRSVVIDPIVRAFCGTHYSMLLIGGALRRMGSYSLFAADNSASIERLPATRDASPTAYSSQARGFRSSTRQNLPGCRLPACFRLSPLIRKSWCGLPRRRS